MGATARAAQQQVKANDWAPVALIAAAGFILYSLVKDVTGGLGQWGSDIGKGVEKTFDSFTTWGHDVGNALDFTEEDDWLTGSHGTLANVGDWLSDVGSVVDFTEEDDWLTGSHGVFASTGDWLGNVGSSIDLTDARKYDWLPWR